MSSLHARMEKSETARFASGMRRPNLRLEILRAPDDEDAGDRDVDGTDFSDRGGMDLKMFELQ